MKALTIQDYLEMLTYRRPAGSGTEEKFINKFLAPLPGAYKDEYGNVHVAIGERPTTLFSSHTDTVHREEGFQKVTVDNVRKEAFLNDPRSNCLGADDTSGMFIMMHMIQNKVPGHYIFHRDEECGGQGSAWIAQQNPDWLRSFKHAVAFDRKDVSHIITEQGAGNGASDAFADALSIQLFKANSALLYEPNTRGTFTDTANYFGFIPECVNLSVGYYDQHTVKERQDLGHLTTLANAVCKVKWHELPTERDPAAWEEEERNYWSGLSTGFYRGTSSQTVALHERVSLDDAYAFMAAFPDAAAMLISELCDMNDLEDFMEATSVGGNKAWMN